jgi:SNF2 family DNA or RNA helicase
MYKSIRKKVASAVSEINKSDDFAWRKWLKEPPLDEFEVEGFETSLYDTNQYNSWLEKPSSNKKKINFRETFVFPELKKLTLKKSKTNTVFFGLGKIDIITLKLLNKEFKINHKPEEIDFRGKPVELKIFECKLAEPEIAEQPCEFNASIIKIDLLDSEILSAEKYDIKDFKIDFETVMQNPKIYKVKILGLDKIKFAKTYFLKNISLHQVRLLRESLKLFSAPAVTSEDIKYFVTEEEPEVLEILQEDIYVPLGNIKPEEVIEEEEELISEIIIEPSVESIQEPVENIDEALEKITEEEKETPVLNENISEVIETKVSEEPEKTIEVKNETVEEVKEEPEAEGSDEYEFESLYYFQETGAEFLLDSRRALLADEMGLGKTIQVVSALKNSFANKKIKSAVIICDSAEIGSIGKISGNVDGWLGHLHQRALELKVEVINGAPQERAKHWKNIPDVLLWSYDSFFYDIEKNIIESKVLKKINCFIFDEVQNLFNKKNFNSDNLSKLINPKYLWALSSYPEKEIKEKLDKVFKEKLLIKNILGRSKKEVENDLPEVTWQNRWLTLDEEQSEEYNEAFESAKEKVQWFLESGNPLRFNANVFTILHQLKQVCNFSEKKGTSRKTDLLLEQVETIAKNRKKVVVFSQYNKAGTKKIEEIFKKNGVKYLSYAPGMSTKDMETMLKNFSKDASVTALITGVKPSKIKIPATEIPYVIHFDIWWNPSSLWQTEEAISGLSKGNTKEKLNVYSYLMKGTVEERIHELLYKKGFLNKHVIETVNPESIVEMITNPEWLEIFDIPDLEFKQRYEKGLLETEKRIDGYSTDEFIERGKSFFSKLGYKNLDVLKNKDNDSFDIRGIIKKAKFDQQMNARFILKDFVKEDEVKKHLTELKVRTNNGKFFLIIKGSFEGDEVVHSNEALIDRRLLTNYFYQFIVI